MKSVDKIVKAFRKNKGVKLSKHDVLELVRSGLSIQEAHSKKVLGITAK